jgi:hypothetical protein
MTTRKYYPEPGEKVLLKLSVSKFCTRMNIAGKHMWAAYMEDGTARLYDLHTKEPYEHPPTLRATQVGFQLCNNRYHVNCINVTFNEKGLSQAQIRFLGIVERRYFDFPSSGLAFNLIELLKGSFAEMQSRYISPLGEWYDKVTREEFSEKYGNILMEAWDYWKFLPKPFYKMSYVEPLALSTMVAMYNEDYKAAKTGVSINVLHFSLGGGNARAVKMLNPTFQVVAEMHGIVDDEQIYLELYDNNRLYAKYNKIIGSRFIAYVVNNVVNLPQQDEEVWCSPAHVKLQRTDEAWWTWFYEHDTDWQNDIMVEANAVDDMEKLLAYLKEHY